MLNHILLARWWIEILEMANWRSFFMLNLLRVSLDFHWFNLRIMSSHSRHTSYWFFHTWSECSIRHRETVINFLNSWFWERELSSCMIYRLINLIIGMKRGGHYGCRFTWVDHRHASLFHIAWIVFIVWAIFNDFYNIGGLFSKLSFWNGQYYFLSNNLLR